MPEEVIVPNLDAAKERKSMRVKKAPAVPPASAGRSLAHASVLDEARRLGLLSGDKSQHVSFRVSPALLEAAKREAGVSSTSQLGELALALLAQPDPVAAFFRRTQGRLGSDHKLGY